MRKKISIVTSLALAFSAIAFIAPQGAQAECKPTKATGKTVGSIAIGSTSSLIKPFNYPAGGTMEPQKTTSVASLSERHMPLSSSVGTSVILWHRDYQGCVHPLNIFMSKKVGDTFSITDENGESKRYRLTTVGVIKKGEYKKSWFTLIGPRQIAMFTCTGVFKSGHYEKNMVFIAVPA